MAAAEAALGGSGEAWQACCWCLAEGGEGLEVMVLGYLWLQNRGEMEAMAALSSPGQILDGGRRRGAGMVVQKW